MKILGLDIGSRFIKAVCFNEENFEYEIRETTFEPLKVCFELIEKFKPEKICATGYGRNLLKNFLDVPTITEIKAFALGAINLLPSCRTIIDIGGQDIKVISIDEEGKVLKFEMNDKCAAGTGKFLEIMANLLGYSIQEFGEISMDYDSELSLSSMCTVFVESEVVSLITKGVPREEITIAIHKSISKRVSALVKRVSLREEIVFVGGCAFNKLLKNFLEKDLGNTLHILPFPQLVGARGAAIFVKN